MDGTFENFQSRLCVWLSRKTNKSAIRRIGEQPISIGTDLGSVRIENQDRVAVMRFKGGGRKSYFLTVLCDGMGGMADGGLSAATAISVFFQHCIKNNHDDLSDMLVQATLAANSAVYSLLKGSGGATLSASIRDHIGNTAAVNVGDSRIYGFGQGQLTQLTNDDTIIGQLKDVENYSGLRRNELLQFIGMGKELEPHKIVIKDQYDAIMMTSDGVHYLDKKMMESVFLHASEPAQAVKRLTEISKWCGGQDNASAAIIGMNDDMNHDDDIGVIKIWDSFGELQFILPDTSPSQILPALKQKKMEYELSEDASEGVPDKKNKKNTKVRRSKKAKKKGKGKIKAVLEVEPQLDIDFTDKCSKGD